MKTVEASMTKQTAVSKFSRVKFGRWRHVIPGGVNLCHRPLVAADRGRAACGAPHHVPADI